jgi:hypothetical protein
MEVLKVVEIVMMRLKCGSRLECLMLMILPIQPASPPLIYPMAP